MDEEARNRAIVEAKRVAKAHSRSTGGSYQRSLDHVARVAGRADWAAFLANPSEDRPEGRVGRWIAGLSPRRRTAAGTAVVGVCLGSMTLLVMTAAQYGGSADLHMPVWLSIAGVAPWAALLVFSMGCHVAWAWRALGGMRTGMVSSRDAASLVVFMTSVIILTMASIAIVRGASLLMVPIALFATSVQAAVTIASWNAGGRTGRGGSARHASTGSPHAGVV